MKLNVLLFVVFAALTAGGPLVRSWPLVSRGHKSFPRRARRGR